MPNKTYKELFLELTKQKPELFTEERKSEAKKVLMALGLSYSTFRHYWFDYHEGRLENPTEEKHTETKQPHVPYSSDGQKYTFYSRKGDIDLELKLTLVDKCFFFYSRHGLDHTELETQTALSIDGHVWQRMKRALKLVKLSPPLSPYSLEQLPEDERKEIIEGKVKLSMKYLPAVAEKKRRRLIANKYKREVLKHVDIYNLIQEAVNEIDEKLRNKTRKIDLMHQTYAENVQGCEDLLIVVSDLHSGARIKWKGKPVYNTSSLIGRLDTIAEDANKSNAKNVHLLLLGDLFESVSFMHLSAIPGLEDNSMFNEGIMRTFDILTAWMSKIKNLKTFRGVSGNHDRVSMSKKVDTKGSGALLCYEMLKRTFGKSIRDFSYHDVLEHLYLKDQNIDIFGSHGDKGLTYHVPELIANHGTSGVRFTLCFSGHLHSRKVLAQGRNFLAYMCPPIVETNKYAVSLGKMSPSGYYLVEFNRGLYTLKDTPIYSRYYERDRETF